LDVDAIKLQRVLADQTVESIVARPASMLRSPGSTAVPIAVSRRPHAAFSGRPVPHVAALADGRVGLSTGGPLGGLRVRT